MNNIIRPPVWKMIKEAINALNGKATYPEIKNYINKKYDNVREGTINCQLIECTVNQPSRIHYQENSKPRICNTEHDFLFSIGRGQVIAYKPQEHGIWEIKQNEYGALFISQQVESDEEEILNETVEIVQDRQIFALESHLRDFLSKNIHLINIDSSKLKLFVDENGRDGIEYSINEIGRIDILAVDQNGDFVILELKLSKGPDYALGQLLRYMGWVNKNMAHGKKVKGIIIANKIDDKLRYAVSVTQNVSMMQYDLSFNINKIDSL